MGKSIVKKIYGLLYTQGGNEDKRKGISGIPL